MSLSFSPCGCNLIRGFVWHTSKAVVNYIAKILAKSTEISFAPFAKKAPITTFPPALWETDKVTNADFIGNFLSAIPAEVSGMTCKRTLFFVAAVC